MGTRRDPGLILFGQDAGYYSWRPVALFFVVYFGAYLGAAILAPLIYWGIQSLPDSGNPYSLVEYLQGQSFPKYVDRVRMAFTVILLVWVIRSCGILGRFGFFWRRRNAFRLLVAFFSLGVVSMGVIIAGQDAFTGTVPRGDFPAVYLIRILVISSVGALVIGWLEEAIFRGMLFRMVYTAMNPRAAVILSAFIFAAVHFKKVPWLNGMEVDWMSGFYVATLQSVSFLFTVEWLVFWNYLLVGLVLNLVFLRTGSLVGCMGLHGGWVLGRNAWRKLVDIPREQTSQFWGTERIVDGYACLLILSLIVIVIYAEWRYSQAKGKTAVEGPA